MDKLVETWLRAVLSHYLAYNPLTNNEGDFIKAKEIVDWVKAQPRMFPTNYEENKE